MAPLHKQLFQFGDLCLQAVDLCLNGIRIIHRHFIYKYSVGQRHAKDSTGQNDKNKIKAREPNDESTVEDGRGR